MEQKIHARDICVLAPYMKQVKMIRFLLRKEHLHEVIVIHCSSLLSYKAPSLGLSSFLCITYLPL